MITAIAVDDEPLALTIVEAFCHKVDFIELQKTFTETAEALKYLRKYPVDLLFLDINMPAMSGIDFYKSVTQNTMVIFTTAYGEYAVEGFNLNAVDYLLKPFEFERFKRAAEKARDYHAFLNNKDAGADQYLFIRADYSLVKIAVADILFIEGLDNYLKIHIEGKKPLIARMSMKTMEEKLSAKEFIRVHRSYIVPFAKIDSVRNKVISIGNEEIPIGTNYVEKVEALLKKP